MLGQERERNLRSLEDLCETMLHGSLCGLGGMTPFPVQSALQALSGGLRRAARAERRGP